MKEPDYKCYQAKRVEAERQRQKHFPKQWWWFGQRDPIARFTAYIAVFTVCLVGVGLLQWSSIQGQLTEMKSGGKDTHDLASAAKRQADATKTLADQMTRQAGDTHNLAVSTKELSDAAKQDQRAWVGVETVTSLPNTFTERSVWRVNLQFFNSGKTPARDTQIAFLSATSAVPMLGPTSEMIKLLEFQRVQAIAPQGRFAFAMGTGPEWVTTSPAPQKPLQSLISNYPHIKKRELILYYYGIVKYTDNGGSIRSTQFCIYMANPDTQEIAFCRAFNDLT